MSRKRQHFAFVGVVLATAAVMATAGPENVLSLVVVFLGFLLLYLAGLGGSASPPEPRAEPKAPKAAMSRKAPQQSVAPQLAAQRVQPDASTPPRRPSAGADPQPPKAREEPAPPAGSPDSEGSREAEPRGGRADSPLSPSENRWVYDQLSGDVHDVSFLPPYASDAEEEKDAAEDEPEDWLPPGFPGGEPQPGREAAEAVDAHSNVPIPRHFALGTVAIIRDLMEPGQVAQVLLEQRRQPKQQFGTLAVEMGFLSPEQLRELLVAQQEGLFTDEEIQSAKQRLQSFRAPEASSA